MKKTYFFSITLIITLGFFSGMFDSERNEKTSLPAADVIETARPDHVHPRDLPATDPLDGLLAVPTPSPFYGPGCPWCSDMPSVVDGPLLSVSMKWCGIAEAPSVADPTILDCGYAPGDFKTMLWRRHERASECIWIDQCDITLRSGGVVSFTDYLAFNDLDVSIGDPGDVVIDPSTELFDTWEQCDMEWASQPKGIIAVSAGKLIDDSGIWIARGVALQGSITRPWMMVADPQLLAQTNERSLAHEAGHVLNLGHVSTAGNLMVSGGSGATLNVSQCNTARNYIEDNPILDPPTNQEVAGFVDFIYDEEDEVDPTRRYLDVQKIAAQDRAATGGDLTIHLALGDIVTDNSLGTFSFFLDTDGKGETGINGAELLTTIEFRGNETTTTVFEPDGLNEFFVPIPELGELVVGNIRIIPLLIDTLPNSGYTGPIQIPVFSEVDLIIPNEAFPRIGLGGTKLFPQALNIRTTSTIDNEPVDEVVGTLKFPEIRFPSISVQDTVSPGEVVPVEVGGLLPNVNLGLFIGQFEVDPGASSDANGDASFSFTVPLEAPPGPTLLTVGINDPAFPNNALTADDVVFVKPLEGPVATVTCPEKIPTDCKFPVKVTVDMTSLPTFTELGSFTAKLIWDPTLVSHVGPPNILSGYNGLVNVNPAAGELIFNGASFTGAVGLVDIFETTFEAIGPPGSLASVEIEFSAAAAARTFFDLLPQLVVRNCKFEIIEAGILGDVNGDLLVNSTDALIILSFETGLPIPPPILERINNNFGDVNGDGVTNSTDALIILTFDAGFPVPYPIGQTFCPSLFVPVSAAPDTRSAKEVKAILVPEENNGIVEVPVYIDLSQADAALGSFAAELNWDPAVYKLLECERGLTPGFENSVINDYEAPSGKLWVANANPSGAVNFVHIFTLKFRMLQPLADAGLQVRFNSMASAKTFEDLLPGLAVTEEPIQVTKDMQRNPVKVYPNPFTQVTDILYTLPLETRVQVSLYNSAGQLVRTLLDAIETSGQHLISWDGRNEQGEVLPNGVYILQVRMGQTTVSRKIIFLSR